MKTGWVLCSKALTCIVLAFLFTACDDQELTGKENKISPATTSVRTACPLPACDECCCFVELNGGSSAALELCGTSNGINSCSGVRFVFQEALVAGDSLLL